MRQPEHESIRALLSPYLDGEVTEEEQEQVEHHLRACSECAAELASLRWTVGLMAQVPAERLPRRFTLRQMDVEPASFRFRMPRLYPLLRGATALAALLLVVVLTVDLGFERRVVPSAAPVAEPLWAVQSPASPEAEGFEQEEAPQEATEAPAAGAKPVVPAQPTAQDIAPAASSEEDRAKAATRQPGIAAQTAITATGRAQAATPAPQPSPRHVRQAQTTPVAGLRSGRGLLQSPWRVAEVTLAVLLAVLASTLWWVRRGGP